MCRETRTHFDTLVPGMPPALELSDLPRLSDAERDLAADDNAVMPAAMDDAQIARRDVAILQRLYVAAAETSIDEETLRRNLIAVADQHTEYRRLWMKSARDSRGFLALDVFVRRARECNHLVVRAKRRLRSMEARA